MTKIALKTITGLAVKPRPAKAAAKIPLKCPRVDLKLLRWPSLFATGAREPLRQSIGAVARLIIFLIACSVSDPALAQDGQLLTELENQVASATQQWQSTVSDAARSLFWILAAIEIAVAAVWLALQSPSLESWFAELVRRIMFVGFFAFVLDQGPSFAKSVVDSLFQLGAAGGSASPAEIFDAGIQVASEMSKQVQFGLFEDNSAAVAAALAMIVVVISFSLVAALFVSVMVEMYVGLLAGMIMLGLGGSSFTKDFALRYLIYAFSVGMKLMALVMIAKIGSEVLIGLAAGPVSTEQYVTNLAIAGLAVVVFVIAIYVPNIMQGVVQGSSVSSGMEMIRHGGQAATVGMGSFALAAGAMGAGFAAGRNAIAGGVSLPTAAAQGVGTAVTSAAMAVGSAAKDKDIGAAGGHSGSLLGLANAKLDAASEKNSPPPKTHDRL